MDTTVIYTFVSDIVSIIRVLHVSGTLLAELVMQSMVSLMCLVTQIPGGCVELLILSFAAYACLEKSIVNPYLLGDGKTGQFKIYKVWTAHISDNSPHSGN